MHRINLTRAVVQRAFRASSQSRSLAALPITEIPQPPPDSRPFDQVPLPTHVEFFMHAGGPTKLLEVGDALYKIDDIVKYRMPMSDYMVVLFDPEEMMKVHKACGPTPVGSTANIWPFLEFYGKYQKKLKGYPMSFTLDMANWKRQRHSYQKGLFGYEDARALVPLFAEAARDGIQLLPQHQDDIFPFLNRMTFEMIHGVLFGSRANALDLGKANKRDLEFINAAFGVMFSGGALMLDPAAQMLPMKDRLPKEMLAQIPQYVNDMWDKFVQDANTVLDIGSEKVNNLLSGASKTMNGVECLVQKYAKDSTIDRDDLVINMGGFLQGGVDTTANSVLWALLRLAQNPEAQEALRKEIKAVPKQKGALWDGEQLASLKLLTSFFDEAMRVKPTTSGHMRLTVDDCEVTSRRTGKTYVIPKGTRINFMLHQYQVDPKFVENPTEFKYDRFSRECKHARRGTPQALVDHPVTDIFSYGPRMCIGARLAKVELMYILAEILDNYKVELKDPSVKIGANNNFLIKPDPVPQFKFTKI